MTHPERTKTIAITGATGFIGQHLLDEFHNHSGITVRALTRGPENNLRNSGKKFCWVRGDLAELSALESLLTPGCSVINLAFPGHWSQSEHIENIKRLVDAAARFHVWRVVHCSTVMVVGSTQQSCVMESTTPLPQSEYEHVKLAIEQAWREGAAGRFDLVIVRPSVVFGPGGKNLAKLAHALMRGSRRLNYLRSALYANRRMNLVHVSDVVSAMILLMDHAEPFGGEIFNIADDEDSLNNFHDVEKILVRELGIVDYAPAGISLPPSMLRAALRLAGRSNSNPERVYDSTKLRQLGWRPNVGIEQGLRDFAAWYLSCARRPT